MTISVVIRDTLMGTLLGYLSAGDLPAATVVAETALQFLYYKYDNPIAAAGGAYVLVRSTSPQEKRLEWGHWLRNLRDSFAWLPDGAIPDGWAHLKGIGREASARKAAEAFVEAITLRQRSPPLWAPSP